jgi:hypothetical protein
LEQIINSHSQFINFSIKNRNVILIACLQQISPNVSYAAVAAAAVVMVVVVVVVVVIVVIL